MFLLAGQNFLTVPQVIGPVLVLDALAAAPFGVDLGCVGAVVGQRPLAVFLGRGALAAFLAAGDAQEFIPLPAFAAVRCIHFVVDAVGECAGKAIFVTYHGWPPVSRGSVRALWR